MRRTKKSELLMGVMIGVYGNWLVAVLGKLEKAVSIPAFLFGLSFFPFIWYFMEAFKEIESQIWVGRIPYSLPLKTFLGLGHIAFVIASLGFAGLFPTEWLFPWFGTAIWFMLMSFERRLS